MAAPETMTGHLMAAEFMVNTRLTTPHNDILEYQGACKAKLEALREMPLIVTIKSRQSAGVHVIESTATSRDLPSNVHATETLFLDDLPRSTKSAVFGDIVIQSTTKPPSEIPYTYLTQNWLPESLDGSGKLVYVHTKSKEDRASGNEKKEWTMDFTVGFQEVEVGGGQRERRYVRAMHFESVEMVRDVRIVYDFVKLLESDEEEGGGGEEDVAAQEQEQEQLVAEEIV